MTTGGRSDDIVGHVLGNRYRVLRRLAKGGMGAVYVAQDERLEREVVIKIPARHLVEDDAGRKRFLREIDAIRRVDHVHVVPILDAGEHERTPWYALRYMRGGSLAERVPHEATLRKLRWLAQIAAALDHCHARGLIHRDVKPGNVLFDEEGIAYLTDFGVARSTDAEGRTRLTQTGLMPGSPAYMAPEQALTMEVGPASDQYALAIAAYEALCGALPYPGGSPVQIAVDKKRGLHPPLWRANPAIARAASDVIDRALAPDPSRRFPSCSTFANALAAGLAGRAAAQTGLSPVKGGGRSERRGRIGVLSVAAGLVMILVVTWLALYDGGPGAGPEVESIPDAEGDGAHAEPRRDEEAAAVVRRVARLHVSTPPRGAHVHAEAIPIRGRVSGDLDGLLTVDGRRLTVAEDGSFAGTIEGLKKGTHHIVVLWSPRNGADPVADRRSIVVDRTPPTLEVAKSGSDQGETCRVFATGIVWGADDPTLTANGQPLAVDGVGKFSFEHQCGPEVVGAFPLTLVARDRAGNEATWEGSLPIEPFAAIELLQAPAKPDLLARCAVRFAHIPPNARLSLGLADEHAHHTARTRIDLDSKGAPAGRLEATIAVPEQGGRFRLQADMGRSEGIWTTLSKQPLIADFTPPRLSELEIRPPSGDVPQWHIVGVVRDDSNVRARLPIGDGAWIPLRRRRFLLALPGPPPGPSITFDVRDEAGHAARATARHGKAFKPETAPPTLAAALRIGPGANHELNLDGTSALRFSLPGGLLPAAWTIECWARADDTRGTQALICQCSGRGVHLLHSPKTRAYVFDRKATPPAYKPVEVDPPTDAAWHHHAMTFDGAQLVFFLDGKRQGAVEVAEIELHATPVTIGGHLRGGAPTPAMGEYFRGALDDVRLSRVLRYQADFTPPAQLAHDENTIVLLDFDHLHLNQPLVLCAQPFAPIMVGTPRLAPSTRPKAK